MCTGRVCFILVLSVLVCFAAGTVGGFWQLFFVEDFDPPDPAVTLVSIFGSIMPPRQWDVFYVREAEKKGIGVLMNLKSSSFSRLRLSMPGGSASGGRCSGRTGSVQHYQM